METTSLPGVLIFTPRQFSDARGWFTESWSQMRMADAGLHLSFVQDNHSYSANKGTLRGLHYQSPPHAQDKLVRCTRGAVLDVAVDYRTGSPHFGAWVAIELTAENGKQVFVPKGFLHGFVTLHDDTEVQYKCTDIYAPNCDGGVRWDDPDLAIDWGLNGDTPLLSAKDAVAPLISATESPFTWQGGT
jgi:dTDP-4-dehydrorhamnose 3,5-epimerase